MPQVPPRALIGIASLSIGIASLSIGIASLFIGIASLSPLQKPAPELDFLAAKCLLPSLYSIITRAREKTLRVCGPFGLADSPKTPAPHPKNEGGGRSPLAPLGLIGRSSEWPAAQR